MGNGTLERRWLARGAVFGLTIGLAALGALAWASAQTTVRAAEQVRTIDAEIGAWSSVSLQLGIEAEALSDYLRADDDLARSPLRSAIGSAGPTLDHLAASGEAQQQDVAAFRAIYDPYSDTLEEVLEHRASGDRVGESLAIERAALAASSMRKQSAIFVARNRQALDVALRDLDQRNRGYLVAATVVGAVDLLLVVVCGLIVLSHQRSLHQRAVDSHYRSQHDTLTGLPNRALLAERLEAALLGASDERPVALLLFDLDRFKEVNDTLGHHVGDLLLCLVAERIEGAIRAGDTVGRLGGDEFAVILAEAESRERAAAVAQRLLDALEQPGELNGTPIDIRASIGLAFAPADGTTVVELLQHADLAMYDAKRSGRGVAVFDPVGRRPTIDDLTLLTEIRLALEEAQLVVHHQPKVDPVDLRCIGTEALVRWQHPRRGLLGPGDFIPMVEDHQLIHALTEAVLLRALGDQRRWSAKGLPLLPVAINVATRALLEPSFPSRVATILDRAGVSGDNLVLEITETALVADQEQAFRNIDELHAMGVRISIDDFGTGHSSLARLHALDIDEIKIDREFVSRLVDSDEGRAVVRAMIDLARALGLGVVAEGVEDQATCRTLVELGCQQIQGFLVARPMPADDLARWIVEVGQPAAVARP